MFEYTWPVVWRLLVVFICGFATAVLIDEFEHERAFGRVCLQQDGEYLDGLCVRQGRVLWDRKE